LHGYRNQSRLLLVPKGKETEEERDQGGWDDESGYQEHENETGHWNLQTAAFFSTANDLHD
jgi:hypothetical protein